VKQIFRRDVQNWLGSDDEDTGDGEEDSEDEEDLEEDLEEDSDNTASKPLYTQGKRPTEVPEGSEMAPSVNSSTLNDALDENTSTTPADDQLHPRPFESRKEFFQRTGNEWQEVLMTSLRWKGIQPETLSVKEIKTRAFEMSEVKWWDCREEIVALEDEQEAAGIGDIITLADRGEGTGGMGRRR